MESVKSEEVEVKSDVLNLDEIKGVEGQSIDLKKYDKKEVEIENVEVLQVPSNFTSLKEGTQEHLPQWVLKVSSGVLETLDSEDLKIEFRASELFNLIQDKNGNLTGFPTGEMSNLGKFVKDLGIRITNIDGLKNLIKEIKGKKALVKAYDKEVGGSPRTYLKFRY